MPTYVQILAWRWPGDKPLPEQMMARLPTHICVIQPQWAKCHYMYWMKYITKFLHPRFNNNNFQIRRMVVLLLNVLIMSAMFFENDCIHIDDSIIRCSNTGFWINWVSSQRSYYSHGFIKVTQALVIYHSLHVCNNISPNKRSWILGHICLYDMYKHLGVGVACLRRYTWSSLCLQFVLADNGVVHQQEQCRSFHGMLWFSIWD